MAATPPASIASHELGAGGEGKVLAAPQAEPLGIGEIVHRRGARRRDVDDAGIRQSVLQPQPGTALLRGRLIAALALAAGGILPWRGSRRTRSLRRSREPSQSTICWTRETLSSRVVGPQRGVGGEKDALLEPDRRALAEARQRRDSRRSMPSADQSRWASSISLSDLRSTRRGGGPCSQLSRMMPATWRPLPAPVPSPKNQPRRNRTAFVGIVGCGGDDIEGLVHRPGPGEMAAMRLAGIDDALELGVGQKALAEDAPAGAAGSGAWAVRPRPSPRTAPAGSDVG